MKQSAIFHTKSTCASEPNNTQSETRTAYGFTAFFPNKYFTLACPKKYHPIIVENAKKNIQIAINTLPNFPNTLENAYWLSAVPVSPVGIDCVVIITSAVRFRITKVSMNNRSLLQIPALPDVLLSLPHVREASIPYLLHSRTVLLPHLL